jgi:hypothetical protein
MSAYRVTFNKVPLNLIVTVEADDPDTAADLGWQAAQGFLGTVRGDNNGVQASADLDGIGADDVEDDT